jgi:hypothetical protein
MSTRTVLARGIISACSLLATISAAAVAQPKPLGPPHFRDAEVHDDKLVFTFPLPNREIDAPKVPLLGIYAWRVTIESNPKVSIVLYTPTPIRSNDHEEVLRAAIIRRCPSTTSTVEECTAPVAGHAQVNPASIRMEITEQSLLSEIRARYPRTFWRIVIEPGGHYEVDQLEIQYRCFKC